MRLLEYSDGGFKLTKDMAGDMPSYAILSHNWGPDAEEVTFRDLVDSTGKNKTGYVYLSGIEEDGRAELAWELAEASKWFTRGWMLQELLAPVSVEFFTKEGR
ncbi:hypothetical protein BGZ57DRAFT_716472, partial [Hyaloscypha finlandica]